VLFGRVPAFPSTAGMNAEQRAFRIAPAQTAGRSGFFVSTRLLHANRWPLRWKAL
jgi:hypothetical protein